jgi:hypothetical protein
MHLLAQLTIYYTLLFHSMYTYTSHFFYAVLGFWHRRRNNRKSIVFVHFWREWYRILWSDVFRRYFLGFQTNAECIGLRVAQAKQNYVVAQVWIWNPQS